MTSREIIRVEKLLKKYEDFIAVNEIDFSVNEGEIFGLLGPNGAGKTTTVEILEGIRTQTSGEAIINGINVSKDTKKVKEIIGVQLQQAAFFDKLTLVEIIEMFGVFYSVKIDAKSILEKVELQDKFGSFYKPLSGGQKQRLSIAVALINDPKVLFLDEPTSGVDIRTRHEVIHLLQELNDQGVTIIMTTHEINAVAAHLPRVVCVNGEIVEDGAPNDIFTPDVLKRTYNADILVTEYMGMKLVAESPHVFGQKDHDH